MKNPFSFFSNVKKITENFEEINKKLTFIKNSLMLLFMILLVFGVTYLTISLQTTEVLP